MANRRGRPEIDDEVALRRVAEYLVNVEESGTRCSLGSAILRTSGKGAGNSTGATLRRLQRKWTRRGAMLLAEERERRSTARQEALARRMRDEVMRGYDPPPAVRNVAKRIHDEMTQMFRVRNEVERLIERHGPAKDVARILERYEEATRSWQRILERHEDLMRSTSLDDLVRALEVQTDNFTHALRRC